MLGADLSIEKVRSWKNSQQGAAWVQQTNPLNFINTHAAGIPARYTVLVTQPGIEVNPEYDTFWLDGFTKWRQNPRESCVLL